MKYKIKPLEWEENFDGTTWPSRTVFGDIVVCGNEHEKFHWRYCFDEYYDEGQDRCESIDDGKKKAEAFYLMRLLPALVEAK